MRKQSIRKTTYFDYNSRISFKSGLSSSIAREIKNSDVKSISQKLNSAGIENDLKNNKMVAWCCDMVLTLCESLNKKIKLNIPKPNGIYVIDFEKLNIKDKESFAFCNYFSARLDESSDKIYSSKTIFFNSFNQNDSGIWNAINKISDLRYETESTNRSHFLSIFIHEFSHCFHEDHMLKNHNETELYKSILKVLDNENILLFKSKYKDLIEKNLSKGACENPFETLAQDLTGRIIDAFDKESFSLINNTFAKSPYVSNSALNHILKRDKISRFEILLKRIWNGKFEKL